MLNSEADRCHVVVDFVGPRHCEDGSREQYLGTCRMYGLHALTFESHWHLYNKAVELKAIPMDN